MIQFLEAHRITSYNVCYTKLLRPRGARIPSSEWRFHAAIYRHRPEASAVLHAHPVNCSALACLGKGIPAFHYMVAIAGGRDIRCADYATFGTPELSDNVIAALAGRKACLMAHHGLTCFDKDLARVLRITSYNVCYTKLLRVSASACCPASPPRLPYPRHRRISYNFV